MKEKRHKTKHKKSYIDESKKDSRSKKRRKNSSESSISSDSDEWVEKKPAKTDREDWMGMTGIIKTYSKDDIKPKQDLKEKKHIDSYNPGTSSRELNPYWKDGGTGVPQTVTSVRNMKQYIKPSDDEDYYSRSSKISTDANKLCYTITTNSEHGRPSSSWRKSSKEIRKKSVEERVPIPTAPTANLNTEEIIESSISKEKKGLYLSNEKMNKLAAKIVKAELMGNMKLVDELKSKLEAAREYRKNNPGADKMDAEDDGVILMSTTSSGNSRPLINKAGVSWSKSVKHKANTHDSSGRVKYFGNDDRYDLAQMFQEEKYGTNYDDDAELAHVVSKNKNPNDDLEDIFLDDISKNKNLSKESEKERNHAINQNMKLEKSLDGCEHCFDSKNMLKHLIVSCGTKIYMALPAKKSLVKGHCILTTIQHSTCVTNLDEDIWEEIMNYRKMITQFFNLQNYDVVFYETATKLHRFPHMVINCVPLPRNVADMASIYFKKALLECEAEWSMNKKVVDLKGKNIRKGIPKGLPYFWIDFGMDPGFGHVIEDQQLFSRNFAEEVIGGMLDLDHSCWKNPKREYGDTQRKKVLDFIKDWKPFERSFKEKE